MAVFTNDQIAEQLTQGYWDWRGQSAHSFSGPGPIRVYLGDLNTAGQDLARAGLAAWEAVSAVTFEEAASAGTAQITFDDNENGATASTWLSGSTILNAHVNVSVLWITLYGSGHDTYTQHVYIHEIGHAIGLGHAGNYNGSATYGVDNLYENDSWQSSIMSYFDQAENTSIAGDEAPAMTPAVADILAVQQLYGSTAEQAGDTVWGAQSTVGGHLGDVFSMEFDVAGRDKALSYTIHDTDGQDTLNLHLETAAQYIDLTPEAVSDIGGSRGNLVLSRGTILENVIGGLGPDTILGNQVGNRLEGSQGKDSLFGGDGGDTLLGGSANDLLSGDEGRDTLLGGGGEDTLKGGNSKDRLFGENGDDVLKGNRGDDTLFGGAGNDTLSGNGGNDTFVFESGHDWINGFEDDRDEIRLDPALWGHGLSVQDVLDLFGSGLATGFLLDFDVDNSLFLKNVSDAVTLLDDITFL
jgi:serralysin